MKTLIETITDKASATFPHKVTKENFEEWRQHWIKTGQAWVHELYDEGLTLTAIKVQQHVDWEKNQKPIQFSS